MELILRSKGVSPALAAAVVADIASKDNGTKDRSLDFHARVELGIDPDELGSPLKAAALSYFGFALGAIFPLTPYLVAAFSSAGGAQVAAHGDAVFLGTSIAAAVGVLIFVGVTVALTAARPRGAEEGQHDAGEGAKHSRVGPLAKGAALGAVRQVFVATIAAGTTYAIGLAVGQSPGG